MTYQMQQHPNPYYPSFIPYAKALIGSYLTLSNQNQERNKLEVPNTAGGINMIVAHSDLASSAKDQNNQNREAELK